MSRCLMGSKCTDAHIPGVNFICCLIAADSSNFSKTVLSCLPPSGKWIGGIVLHLAVREFTKFGIHVCAKLGDIRFLYFKEDAAPFCVHLPR
eukprot:432482-Amphidinium_carterae.1